MKLKRFYIIAVMTFTVFTGTGVPGSQIAAPVKKGNNPRLPRIAIITTGGTIAEKKNASGASVPAVAGEALVEAVPGILKLANVEIYDFCNEDSSRIKPGAWLGVAKLAERLLKREDISGLVITHGTDSMAQAALFFELCLNSDKPVVVTGAMRDSSSPAPDGLENILTAVVLAGSKTARGWGVCVSLNQYVNAAFRVRKTNTGNVQTFNSGEYGYLGYVAGCKVFAFNRQPERVYLGIPATLPKVAAVMSYAGGGASALKQAVADGARGIVVEGVGSGNVNTEVYNAVKAALKKGITVVITTEVPDGLMLPAYGGAGGGASLEKSGAILSRTLRTRKARVLLMLALAAGKSHDEMKKFFAR